MRVKWFQIQFTVFNFVQLTIIQSWINFFYDFTWKKYLVQKLDLHELWQWFVYRALQPIWDPKDRSSYVPGLLTLELFLLWWEKPNIVRPRVSESFSLWDRIYELPRFQNWAEQLEAVEQLEQHLVWEKENWIRFSTAYNNIN